MGIMYVHHFLDEFSPICFGTPRGDFGLSLALKRFEMNKNIAGAIAFILGIIPLYLAGVGVNWNPGFFHHLLAAFIHAYNRLARVIGLLVDIQDIFHFTHKPSITFRRNAPLFF